MKKLVFLFMVVALLGSCGKKTIGKWGDIIKLSVKNVVFGSHADSVIITTGGSWWWITAVRFDDSVYDARKYDNLNRQPDTVTIAEKHFTVQKRGKHQLFVKLDKNTTGKDRTLNISLEAGDYFDGVNIKQLGR